MKNENGVAIPVLIITIAVIIIVAMIGLKYGIKIINETQLQDLRTDMLVIQAETKKGLEEFCFQTANLNKNKEEDLNKINNVKKECLKGVLVQGSEIENNNIPEGIIIDENCYYLNEEILKEIGVKEFDSEKYGYYIVKYDFDNIKIEVINTKGYEGVYTLTELENR